MENAWSVDWIYSLIGSDAETIVWWQMSIRAVLIFFYTLIVIRIGSTRIFGKRTSFDIVIGVILGSILSRALTGNARFFPTLAAAATLMIVHMLLTKIALQSRITGHLIKGKEIQLIENGRINWRGMRKGGMTEHDLHEALRTQKGVSSVQDVKAAYLERSGKVSVII